MPKISLKENAESINKYYLSETSKGNPYYEQQLIKKNENSKKHKNNKVAPLSLDMKYDLSLRPPNTCRRIKYFSETNYSFSRNDINTTNSTVDTTHDSQLTNTLHETTCITPSSKSQPDILSKNISKTIVKKSKSKSHSHLLESTNNIESQPVLQKSLSNKKLSRKSSIIISLENAQKYLSGKSFLSSNHHTKSQNNLTDITTNKQQISLRWEDHMNDSPDIYKSISTMTVTATSSLYKALTTNNNTNTFTNSNILRIENTSIILTNYRITYENKQYNMTLHDEVEEIVFRYLEWKHFQLFKESIYYRKYLEYMFLLQIPITVSDFVPLRIIGRGGFGLVSRYIYDVY